MASENPFYMWSILEAWDWLINVPVVGFILLFIFLFVLGIFVVMIALAIAES